MSAPSIYAKLADALKNDWRAKARPEQLAPPGEWSIWLLLAGRGSGKTRAAAEHIRGVADSGRVFDWRDGGQHSGHHGQQAIGDHVDCPELYQASL